MFPKLNALVALFGLFALLLNLAQAGKCPECYSEDADYHNETTHLQDCLMYQHLTDQTTWVKVVVANDHKWSNGAMLERLRDLLNSRFCRLYDWTASPVDDLGTVHAQFMINDRYGCSDKKFMEKTLYHTTWKNDNITCEWADNNGP